MKLEWRLLRNILDKQVRWVVLITYYLMCLSEMIIRGVWMKPFIPNRILLQWTREHNKNAITTMCLFTKLR